MLSLQTSRLEFERKVADGATHDLQMARARHAMTLASAVDELDQHLSREQQTYVRRLTQILAATVVCGELSR
jgi:hypothetical protein